MIRRELLRRGLATVCFSSTLHESLRAETVPCTSDPTRILPDQARYVDGISNAENAREAMLGRYSAHERYTVYRRGESDPKATRIVQVEYVNGRGKIYVDVDRQGSSVVQRVLIDRLIREQQNLSTPDNRLKTLLTGKITKCVLLAMTTIASRECVVITLHPKSPSEFVVDGFVAADAMNYHLVRVDGILAKRPTFWASSPHLTRDYSDVQGFFLATHLTSIATSILLGTTQVEIEYSYDAINA